MLRGNAGSNILNGGAGNGSDTFIASLNDGNDAYSGGGGNDTYDLSLTTAGATVMTGSSSSAETGTDLLTSIENIIGSQGNDSITVNGGNNLLDGQGGADSINGGAGNDTLDGGAGDDTLIGGTGNDTLLGGVGNDVFTYTFGDGVDSVDGGDDLDTLNIMGTATANTLDVIWDGAHLTNFEGGTLTSVETVVDLGAARIR